MEPQSDLRSTFWQSLGREYKSQVKTHIPLHVTLGVGVPIVTTILDFLYEVKYGAHTFSPGETMVLRSMLHPMEACCIVLGFYLIGMFLLTSKRIYDKSYSEAHELRNEVAGYKSDEFRAQVHLEPVRMLDSFGQNQKKTLVLELTNFGKARARAIVIRYLVDVISGTTIPNKISPKEEQRLAPLDPGRSWRFDVATIRPLTGKEMQEIHNTGQSTLFAYVEVYYEDGYGIARVSIHCWRWVPGKGWTPEVEHTDPD